MAADVGAGLAPPSLPGSLLGLFEEPEAVARSLEALRAVGVGRHDLQVLSSAPYPEGAFGEEPERHRLFVFPLIGAACGFAVGLLVTIGTQLAYPLVTGGKPILAIPPMVNVLYGGTLLGAILLTIFGILFESRLPDSGPAPYDARITTRGYLGVLVTRTDGVGRDEVARILRGAGAVDVIEETGGARQETGDRRGGG